MQEPENFTQILARSFAESVFSNMFPERGTPVLFALCHAKYWLREKRDQNKQWLLGEHIAF